jgi:ADP-ribosylglycohydrolase
LRLEPEGEECAVALERAIEACETEPPSPETVESIGEGWVGEEALAIGLYAALAAGDDLARGLCLAVNHSGDSDSTGAIAGNILGAELGLAAIPISWLETLELRDEIRTLAHDAITGFAPGEWCRRYPGL